MNDLKKILTTYEVNPQTMAILSQQSDNLIISLVIEVNDTFLVAKSPTEIIKHSCKYFGSSYRGRTEGTQSLIGISHKAPIAISPTSNLFFFPTHSPKRPECCWFSHTHITKLSRNPLNQTIITFPNQTTYTIDISLGSFENQVHRTAQLRSTYSDRYTNINHEHSFELVKEDDIPMYIKRHIK